MPDSSPLPDRHPTLRLSPLPADTSRTGDIHGGWIMSRMDDAAGIVARQHARSRVATVSATSMSFKAPVKVGDVVSVYARVVKVGRSSMQIEVEVFAERLPPAGEGVQKVTEATFAFVALDDNGRPRAVDPVA